MEYLSQLIDAKANINSLDENDNNILLMHLRLGQFDPLLFNKLIS